MHPRKEAEISYSNSRTLSVSRLMPSASRVLKHSLTYNVSLTQLMHVSLQTGYPDKYLLGQGFSVAGASNCRWCPENGPQNCGLHRQSPINLERNRGIVGDPMEKECPDWHFMHAQEGSCTWDDMLGQFEIARHALKLNMPVQSDGQVDCVDEEGLRRFPRMDYSKGFPDWWWLDHTSVQVPSQHTQEGKRYDGEVSFNHFYEIPHPKNQVHIRWIGLLHVSMLGLALIYTVASSASSSVPCQCSFRPTMTQPHGPC